MSTSDQDDGVPVDGFVSPWPVPGQVETPALVVDYDRVLRNVQQAAQRAERQSVALRPHAKTHKSVAVARLQLAAGAVGLTVATLSEAEVFADAGFNDIFVAYPVWAGHGAKARRLSALAERITLTIGIDNPESVRALDALKGKRPRVLIELDCGGARSGTAVEECVALAEMAAASGLELMGVFTHGGHGYAGVSSVPAASADEDRALAHAHQVLNDAGHACVVRSAGSTPTSLTGARPAVTEERPGTYVFGDRQQVALGSQSASEVALFVSTTVVAVSADRFVVDAGAKVLSKDAPGTVDGYGAVADHPEYVIESLYDHHAVVRTGRSKMPRVGDSLLIIPNHVCPVVNLAREMVLVTDGEVVGSWPVDASSCNT